MEAIWHEFSADLRRAIRSRVADPATAEDILQDVFVKLHRNLPQLPESAKVEAWLHRVARNAIIDHYRSRKETIEVPEDLSVEAPAPGPETTGLNAATRRMIESLPEPDRSALIRTEIDGLTQRELAAELGISLSGAKSRVQRARERLKAMLEDCCRFEFDRLGRAIECEPRRQTRCSECQ